MPEKVQKGKALTLTAPLIWSQAPSGISRSPRRDCPRRALFSSFGRDGNWGCGVSARGHPTGDSWSCSQSLGALTPPSISFHQTPVKEGK